MTEIQPAGTAEHQPTVKIEVDGRPLIVHLDQSLAAVLIHHGWVVWRTTSKKKEPRGYFCGIGICQDCLVTIDGVTNVQACRTKVRSGMSVTTQTGLPLPEK